MYVPANLQVTQAAGEVWGGEEASDGGAGEGDHQVVIHTLGPKDASPDGPPHTHHPGPQVRVASWLCELRTARL